MKMIVCIGLVFISCRLVNRAYAQELPLQTEQQFEQQAEASAEENEDDSYLQDLQQFLERPVNLNAADADLLRQLHLLNELQIAQLLSYRRLLGAFIHLYELQAIPGWDLLTIRKILPFVTIARPVGLKEEARKRLREGEQQLLFRVSQVLQPVNGEGDSAAALAYKGSPQRLLLRYRYQYKNSLQFGWLGEKDAGEQFFRGAQRRGFDFNSLHFFARRLGILHSLALGDFSVSLGQGLLHWQGLAFRKSADVLAVKRQSPVLKPYRSAGEFYFHRGAGITLRKGIMEATLFYSRRRLDVNRSEDSLTQGSFFTSFVTTGYHRNAAEQDDRGQLLQWAGGGNLAVRGGRWQAGINSTWYRFSLPVRKRDEPYNIYSIKGRNWNNLSLDYSGTVQNLHLFGEAALDKNRNPAWVNGLLISAGPRADLSLLYRGIHKAYQSVFGNAFTENSLPGNERGLFTGICLRPAPGWRLDAYADIYFFPWLKYRSDAPSRGKEFLLQLQYVPSRQVELYSRLRVEYKESNQPVSGNEMNTLEVLVKHNWRTHVILKLNPALTFRSRVELVWLNSRESGREEGFLWYADLLYKPMLRPFSLVGRLQYFETDSYQSRIYAYENDVRYSYSIPAYSGSGLHYYLNLHYQPLERLGCWLRWAQTKFHRKNGVEGPGPFSAENKTVVSLQVIWDF